jgi:hypothetical protein
VKKKTALLILIYLPILAILPISGYGSLKDELSSRLHSGSEDITDYNVFSVKIWEKKEMIMINATDYPGSNDTERLQAALNAVPPEGATVLVSGLWTAYGLVAKSNTTILGENGTIQRPEDTTSPFLLFENKSDFAVVNMTFDGRGISDNYGIEIINGRSFVIQDNTFLNIKRNAVKAWTTTEGVSDNFTINNNTFVNCDNAPLLIFGNPSMRRIRCFMICNNTVTNGTVNGKIGVAFAADGQILNNTVVDSQFGIATRCVTNITIKGNVVKNAKDYGIYLGTQIGDSGTDHIQIECNEIADGTIGIARYYGSYPIKNVTIKNNRFVNNSLFDIVADFPAVYINNTITLAEKLVIRNTGTVFVGTRTITGGLILPGDVNSDLKIDIIDVAVVAIAFGRVKGSVGWDSRADIIQDDVVDIKDVAYVSRNFGMII